MRATDNMGNCSGGCWCFRGGGDVWFTVRLLEEGLGCRGVQPHAAAAAMLGDLGTEVQAGTCLTACQASGVKWDLLGKRLRPLPVPMSFSREGPHSYS